VLWAIFTSIPQPIFAIPAYLFVEKFATLLPIGLGFAAGAMCYVAVFELLVEAAEETGSVLYTGAVGALSCWLMTAVQNAVRAI
jgi:zinc transporter, ZIP family